MIIDCHTHLSVLEDGQTFESAAAKMLGMLSQNGVTGAMVIADNVSNDVCANTERIQQWFKGAKNIWVVGSSCPFEPESRVEPFAQLIQSGEIVAMKLFPGHDKIYLDDPRYFPDIELCERLGVPLMIHTGVNTGDLEAAQYNDPKYIAQIARNHPALVIVVCHYYWPRLQYCFDILGGMDNVYFDTSALADPEVVEACGGRDAVVAILEKTLAGRPGSVLFGTDYPMCDIKEHLRLIEELNIDNVSKEEVLGLTAQRLYGI